MLEESEEGVEPRRPAYVVSCWLCSGCRSGCAPPGYSYPILGMGKSLMQPVTDGITRAFIYKRRVVTTVYYMQIRRCPTPQPLAGILFTQTAMNAVPHTWCATLMAMHPSLYSCENRRAHVHAHA